MHQGKPSVARVMLRRCAIDQVRKLGKAGDEGGKTSLDSIVALRMAGDAREVADALDTGGAAAAASAAVRVAGAGAPPAAQAQRQRALLAAAGGEFEVIEPVLALHAVLLRRFAPAETCRLAHLLLHSAATARQSGCAAAAVGLAAEAQALPESSRATVTAIAWEHAQLLWHEGSNGQPCARSMARDAAMELAKCAASLHAASSAGGAATTSGTASGTVSGGSGDGWLRGTSDHERRTLAQACRRCAGWSVAEGMCNWDQAAALYELALSVCEPAPSTAQAGGGGGGGTSASGSGAGADAGSGAGAGAGAGESRRAYGIEERCNTHAAYAAWLESEHRLALQQSGRTPEEMRGEQLYRLAERELATTNDQLAALPPPPRAAGSAAARTAESLQRRLALLRGHVETHQQARARRRECHRVLAASALRQHAACARTGDAHDHTSLFAMVGLWLEYGGELPEAEAELCSLPSHKLLPLIWQLACRLGAGSGPDAAFQASLRKVLVRVAKAHLHTVLPHVLALSYGDRFATNEEMPSIVRGPSGFEPTFPSPLAPCPPALLLLLLLLHVCKGNGSSSL